MMLLLIHNEIVQKSQLEFYYALKEEHETVA